MSKVTELNETVGQAFVKLEIDKKIEEIGQLNEQTLAPNFWSDNQKAGAINQRINLLREIVEPWQNLQKNIQELVDLEKMHDKSLESDIERQYLELEETFNSLKKQLRFNGKYDSFDAVLNIHAGAGGTDAQDWAQMLLRMYTRYAEASGMKTALLDESAGDEAGIKSASLLLSGTYAYGKLKGEHGVHRLVRLSPFNANNLRQTSFAKVEVLPKIEASGDDSIDEKDLRIDVFRSGGRGGQSVNTTDSAVRVTHIPTGISVSIQNERSQIQNKETAMTILRSKLFQLKEEQHSETLSEIKGPDKSAEWGNQIRNYVLHPYTMVKDQRSKYETTDAEGVLSGDLQPLIDANLDTK